MLSFVSGLVALLVCCALEVVGVVSFAGYLCCGLVSVLAVCVSMVGIMESCRLGRSSITSITEFCVCGRHFLHRYSVAWLFVLSSATSLLDSLSHFVVYPVEAHLAVGCV